MANERDRNIPGRNEQTQRGEHGSSSPSEQQRQQTGVGNRQQGESDRGRSSPGQGGQGQQQQQGGGQRQQGGSTESKVGRDSERDREDQMGQSGGATGRERDR